MSKDIMSDGPETALPFGPSRQPPLLKLSDEAEFKRRFAEWLLTVGDSACHARELAEQRLQELQQAGIAEKPLEEGFYWVQAQQGGGWEAARYATLVIGGLCWCYFNPCRNSPPHVIGPRIEPPAEQSGGPTGQPRSGVSSNTYSGSDSSQGGV